MDLLATIGSGLAAVVSGGMTGILGGGLQLLFTWLGAKAETEKLRAQNEFEINKIKAQSEANLAEWGARQRVAEVNAEGARDVADAKALQESHKAEGRSYLKDLEPPQGDGWWASTVRGIVWLLLGLMEALRAIVRPGLTLYLAWITTQLYFEAKTMVTQLGVEWRQDVAAQVYVQIVYTILYLFVTCVSWWFVTRNKSKPPVTPKVG